MNDPSQPIAARSDHKPGSCHATALESLAAPVATLDEGGCIVATNAAWREIVSGAAGPQDDSVGLDYRDVCSRAEGPGLPPAEAVSAGITELLAGSRARYEHEYRARDGRAYVLRARHCSGGRERRFILIHEDITSRGRAHREGDVDVSHAGGAPADESDGVLTLAADGEVLSCDATAARLFGFPKRELRGMYFAQMLVGEIGWERALRRVPAGACRRLQGMSRDGEAFPLEIRCLEQARQPAGDCRTISVRRPPVLTSPATERLPLDRLIEKLRLERGQRKLKERYISLMSHELRTPLTSIQLSHDMLAHYSEQATPEERRKYLDNIRAQVRALNDIVSDVVDLSRSYHSPFEFKPAEQDLVDLCGEAVNSFAFAHEATHDVSFECPAGEIRACFDRNLLRRALNNLLGNAIKYSPAGGNVRIRVWREGDRAHLTIADEGIGIPADDLDFLFLAFHRAGNVGSLPGTGLGLAIVKQTLDAHAGDIHITSEVGKGTTVAITLPLRRAAEVQPLRRAPQPALRSLTACM